MTDIRQTDLSRELFVMSCCQMSHVTNYCIPGEAMSPTGTSTVYEYSDSVCSIVVSLEKTLSLLDIIRFSIAPSKGQDGSLAKEK